MPGVLGNVCGDWLNLWVNLGKKDMLPKVLSFSLFWEDSEDGTVSSLKCFLPSNFFLYCSDKSYWIHILSLLCAFFPHLQLCFIYKPKQTKPTTISPPLSRSQLYTSAVSCYTGFFWEDGGTEGHTTICGTSCLRAWLTLLSGFVYHSLPCCWKSSVMQAFIQIVGR